VRGKAHILTVTIGLGATALALLGAGDLAGAAKTGGASTPSGAPIIAVLGPKTNVPPGKFVRAYAMCPKGYFVTGGGSYAGAITEIISSPLPSLRGWFVDGNNTTKTKRTFQHRATAVCAKGAPVPTTTAAAAAAMLRRAQTDFTRAHGTLATP
jgi:hypothetical protein